MTKRRRLLIALAALGIICIGLSVFFVPKSKTVNRTPIIKPILRPTYIGPTPVVRPKQPKIIITPGPVPSPVVIIVTPRPQPSHNKTPAKKHKKKHQHPKGGNPSPTPTPTPSLICIRNVCINAEGSR